MNVSDLATLNLLRAACGCCGLPICEEGTIKCESVEHKSYCADNDYTDALAIWQAKKDAHDNWRIEHDAFPAAYAAWVIEKAAWDAEDPCTRGPEPVEPVDPTEPPDEGTEPDKDDYDERYDLKDHSCYAPFKEPDGEPGDDIPSLYSTHEGLVGSRITGIGWAYNSGAGTSPLSAERLTVGTYTDYWSGPEPVVNTGNVHDKVADTCTPTDPSDGAPNYVGPFSVDYSDPVEETICEATERGVVTKSTASSGSPTPMTLEGCPAAGVDFDEVSENGYSYELEDGSKDVLSDPVTKSTLAARAISNLPTTWPDEPVTGTCVASMVIQWPKIKDFYVGADPEADPPVEGSWPPCNTGYASVPETFALATKFRYKMGVPEKYMAHRLWIIEKAAWDLCESCTPGECGAGPVEPQIFHYFAKQWDVVKFPKAWDAWRVLWDAWVLATAAHEQWVIDHAAWVTAGSDPDTEPEEPEVPADPTADQPDDRPTFIDEDLTWTWTGGETEAEQYETEWHEVDAPTDEAQIRIVNQQEWCYQIEGQNVPPTYRGEIYNPDDYPE